MTRTPRNIVSIPQLFAAYRAETKACVRASWRSCVALFQMLPVLPAVQCAVALSLFAADDQAVFPVIEARQSAR